MGTIEFLTNISGRAAMFNLRSANSVHLVLIGAVIGEALYNKDENSMPLKLYHSFNADYATQNGIQESQVPYHLIMKAGDFFGSVAAYG